MCAYMYIDCGMFYHMYMRDQSVPFFPRQSTAFTLCTKRQFNKSRDDHCAQKHSSKNLGFNYQAQCTHLSDICEVVVPLVAGARGARPCATGPCTTRRCASGRYGSNRRCAIGRSSACRVPSSRVPGLVPFSELVVHQFYQRRKAAEQLELWPLYGWPDLGEVLLVQQSCFAAEVEEQAAE